MSAPSRLYNFTTSTTISSSQVNAEFNQLIAALSSINTDGTFRDIAIGTGVIPLRVFHSGSKIKISFNGLLSGSTWTSDDNTVSTIVLSFENDLLLLSYKAATASTWSDSAWDRETEITGSNGDLRLKQGKLLFSTDTNLYRDSANVLKTDDALTVDGAAVRIPNGSLVIGVDTNLYRSAVNTLKTDDNLTVAQNINLETGGSIYSPDVDGSTASSGKFVGGSGGFMWFDGVTAGTSVITLDSTLDWRDREIYATGRLIYAATPVVPGDPGDNLLFAYTLENVAPNLETVNTVYTNFYSEAGSSGAGTNPQGTLYGGGGDTVYLWADSANGNLMLGKSVDTGIEASYSLLVHFSDDQGHV